MNHVFPAWTSVVVYLITGVFVLLFHETAVDGSVE
jgi:hypothetical protein